MAAFYARAASHPKTVRRTTMNRLRCTNCKGYFDRSTFYYGSNGLTRICTEDCFNEWKERRRRPSGSQKQMTTTAAPKTPVEVRFAIKERDGYRCRFCGRQGTQVHHVIYRSQGGDHQHHNLILLCDHCHGLVHSSKITYQSVLLATLWLHYVHGLNLTVPQTARYLDALGLLTELQQHRMGVAAEAS